MLRLLLLAHTVQNFSLKDSDSDSVDGGTGVVEVEGDACGMVMAFPSTGTGVEA